MLFTALAAAAAVNLAACEFGERNPQAPQELEQYSFLIGNHEMRTWRWDAENENWGKGYLTTRWNGWWALDGFAIADEWFDVQYPSQPPAMGRGINIRMWDAENKRWSNMWMHTRTSTVTELHSEMEDGKMVMYQVYPETTTKLRSEFEVFDDGNWTRITYVEDEDGNLTPTGRLDGIKLSCTK
jgi:hypothetical protein